jgi:hypothetical protein
MTGRRASDRAREEINELPLFVVRRDSVGTAADALFGTVQDIGPKADYWAPEPAGEEASD